MSVGALDRVTVTRTVKSVVVAESRLSIDPGTVRGDEPLSGELLRVNSFGFVGMLVRLEDELGVTLPDDLFVGRTFTTVDDLVAVVLDAVEVAR
ncbi:acyl carrier protein [Saccharothrix sp. BKS2]|uniref:acyl carrier protein n=1 Tax=Saccharothrix sp. BKS2 TaxID=3064400 RepID=UPI0039E7C885